MKMKFNVKKFIAKVLVTVLVISMMPSFGVDTDAAVAQLDSLGVGAISGGTIFFNVVDDINYVELISGGYRYGTSAANITGSYTYDYSAYTTLNIGSNLTLAVKTDITFSTINLNSGAKIKNSSNVHVNSLTATPSTVITESGGIWTVTDSYTASGFNSEFMGTVVANSDTTINSDGGTFTLIVGTKTRLVSGAVSGTAGEIVNETLDPSGLRLTASGYNYVDGKYYVKDSVTINATTGYTWALIGSTDYRTSNPINQDSFYSLYNSEFKFKSNDGETTETLTVSDYLLPEDLFFEYEGDTFTNVVFDDNAPIIASIRVPDENGTSISFSSGITISENSCSISIDDGHYFSVTVSDGRTFGKDNGVVERIENEVYEAVIPFQVTAGETKTFTITATDYSLNTRTFTFTLGKEDYLSSDGLKCTITGLVNEKYSKDKITVKAPDGYEIMPSYGSGDKYVESVDYKWSDLYDSKGKFLSSLTFTFKRKSDGAVTKPVSWEKCADFLDDVIFDETNPAISTVVADGKTITFTTGAVIEAASISFTVADVNLEKIVVDKTTIDRTGGVKKDGNTYKGTVAFSVQAGESKTYKFTAYDYAGRTVEYTFTLKYPRQVPALTVSLKDQFAGVAFTPTITTVSDGASNVKYYYAKNEKASVSQNSFSETVPTEPGKYVVKAVIPETTKYLSATAYGEFTISYIDAPATAYTVQGEIGENDYYISDVTLKAPTGYKISTSLTGKYGDSVTYSSGLTAIYLKRTSDGALTGPIAFENSFLIDTSKPGLAGAAKTQSGMVVDLNKLIFANSITFTIEDENLASVTVNNDPILISEGKAVITLTVNGHKTFVIKATDKAGNTYSFTVDLKAIWMESGVIPVGILVSLEPGVGYPLDPGEWLVEDDITLYYGGCDIYVTEDTELTLLSAED